MKKMFLASSFKDTTDLFLEFKNDLSGKKVTFIPTASNVEKVVFYVNSGRKALEKAGFEVDVLDISTASAEDIKEKIAGNDYIYVTGGNTFFLLQELKRTGADKLIVEAVNGGKIYIGESAGAMVTAPDIEYAKAMDSVKKAPKLEGFDALGLVDFYTVPHCENMPFKAAAKKIIDTYSETLKLVAINNGQAIVVNGEEFRIV